jgi:hypothetical protein
MAEEARIEFAKSALDKFYSLAPSEEDEKAIQDELLRLRRDPGAGTLIPFGQLADCYLTWAGKWRIVYKTTGNPGNIYVVHIDNEMPHSGC